MSFPWVKVDDGKKEEKEKKKKTTQLINFSSYPQENIQLA